MAGNEVEVREGCYVPMAAIFTAGGSGRQVGQPRQRQVMLTAGVVAGGTNIPSPPLLPGSQPSILSGVTALLMSGFLLRQHPISRLHRVHLMHMARCSGGSNRRESCPLVRQKEHSSATAWCLSY